MGTHVRVLSERFQINTNMAGSRWFSKILVLWTKVASALEGLRSTLGQYHSLYVQSVVFVHKG